MYWTAKHNEAIKLYYNAQFDTNCNAIRNSIIDRTLYKPLNRLVELALKSLDINDTDSYFEDYKQDVLIHLITNSLPKLKIEKLDATLSYLWVSARNYILSYILKKNLPILEDINEYSEILYEELNFDEKESIYINRNKIIRELDKRIKGQNIINTTNTVFLLLLKDYILENNFDVRGFGNYVMESMNLKLSTYRAIAGRLGIRTKVLNEKLINK